MKIGYFTSVEGWGGSENYLLGLMQAVQSRGHKVILFGIKGSPLFSKCRNLGIESIPWHDISPVDSFATPQSNFSEKVNNKKQTVSLFGAFKAKGRNFLPVWLKLLIGTRKELKTLVKLFSCQDIDVMQVNVHGYEVAGFACAKLGIPSLGMYCIMPEEEPFWYRRRLIKKTINSYSLVAGKSQACVQAWRKLGHIAESKCIHIYNGIDTHRFSPRKSRFLGKQLGFRLISVGRLHPMKGYSYLLKALSLCADKSIFLTLVGTGPEETKLRHLAQHLNLEKRIKFWGYSEEPEMLYQNHDCFVLPSLSESFGSVVTEAMSCELPVITSDFGPFPEINIHGQTGLIVQQKNPQALAEAIQTLAENRDLCQRFGTEGRKRVKELFSISSMVRKTIRTYEELSQERHQ